MSNVYSFYRVCYVEEIKIIIVDQVHYVVQCVPRTINEGKGTGSSEIIYGGDKGTGSS